MPLRALMRLDQPAVTHEVPADDRTHDVPAETRQLTIPADDTSLEVT